MSLHLVPQKNKKVKLNLVIRFCNYVVVFLQINSIALCFHVIFLILGPVYTKRQHQWYDNSVMMLVILLSSKTMESLENELQSHSGVTPLFSRTAVSPLSSQSCHSIDFDAKCKWGLYDALQIRCHWVLLEEPKNVCKSIDLSQGYLISFRVN